MNLSIEKQRLMVGVVLTIITFAVYWQVTHYDFVSFDDNIYVTENIHIRSGMTLDGILWAFSTRYFDGWHPLVWLSFILDYEFFGLNAEGYHLTNLILHILNTLLIFWLFSRMTGVMWRSAFIAAFFALHPLHVESVAWISERKDVLSAFFGILSLCVYVYYTEKPDIRRYLPVLFLFICALTCKPMVVTLPVIMMLLDYWPLSRCRSRSESGKNNLFLWQLKEKAPFFILSVFFVVMTVYSHPDRPVRRFPLDDRLYNASVSFIAYLEKTFWPHNMAVFYPFPVQIPLWQVAGASLLIIAVTMIVFKIAGRFPHWFAGWLWYAITVAPVIGVIQVSNHAMADRYTYLPSIGIAVLIGWGVPAFFKNEEIKKKILFPAGIIFLAMLSILTWKQAHYWENTTTLFTHALNVTENNYIAHNNLGIILFEKGKIAEAVLHFNKSIHIEPDYIDAYINLGNAYAKLGESGKAFENFNKAITMNPNHLNNFNAYNNRGVAYAWQGKYVDAINDFNKSISLKPDYAESYYNRGVAYANMDRYPQAIDDYTRSIALKPDYADAYYNRGVACTNERQYQRAIVDYDKAIHLKPDYADAYYNRGISQYLLGHYEPAIKDFSQTINLNKDDAEAYNSRAIVYLNQGNRKLGCSDAQKACTMNVCAAFKIAKEKRLCR